MGKICGVKSCPSGRKKKKNGSSQSLSFFRPTTPAKLKDWSMALGIKLKPTHYICHHHFKQEDIKMFENFNINGKVTILPIGKKILRDEALPTVEHQFIPAIELQKGDIYKLKMAKSDSNQTEEKQQNQRPNIEHKDLLVDQEVSSNLMDVTEQSEPDLNKSLNQAHNDLQINQDTEVKTQSVENFWDTILKSSMLPQFWLYIKKPNGLEFIRTDPMTGQIKNYLRLNEDTSVTVIFRNKEELNLNEKISPLRSIHDYLKSVERWPLCVGTQIENNKYSKVCKGVIIGDEAYKRNQQNARCKSCRILRHRLQNRKSMATISERSKGCASNLFKQCKRLKRIDDSKQCLLKTVKPARTSLATSSSKKNLAKVLNKKPINGLGNKPASETQVNHRQKQHRTEKQTSRLCRECDIPSDTDSAVLPEAPAEESVVPGPKNFSWQKTNEIVQLLSDDVETEVARDNLSMYCDDEKHASMSSEQLDGNPKGTDVSHPGHEVFRCNVCDAAIAGFRYTCVQCSDLDLCGACEADRAHHHHYVLRMPADRHSAEVQLVLATIQRHLMRKLDPTAQHDQNQNDVISLKSEIKSEAEDDNDDHNGDDYNDDTKDKSPEDGVKGSSSPSTQKGDFDQQAHSVDSGEGAPQGECGEARENTKITKIYLKMADFKKMKERGVPWVKKLDSNKTPCVKMASAQPSAKAVSDTVPADSRPRVQVSVQPQHKFTGVLHMKQKDLRTKIIKEQDVDEDPLSQVNIKNIQNNLKYTGQLDSIDSKIISTGAKSDEVPGIRAEATARDVQSNICLPEAQCAKSQCSVKIKRLPPQVLGNAGTKL